MVTNTSMPTPDARMHTRRIVVLVAVHALAACDPGGELPLDSSPGASTSGAVGSTSAEGAPSPAPDASPDGSDSRGEGPSVPAETDDNDDASTSGDEASSSSTSSSGTGGGVAEDFECTEVIGYSQVRQWYQAGFEAVVDDDRWQLRWNGGAAVDRWARPDYQGWDNDVVSPCAQGSDAPDRVILSVSGGFGDDEAAWSEAIEAAIGTIRDKHPSASSVVLQPVVGGPNHETCMHRGQPVRASWQHMHIDEAIATVLGADVSAGFSPEVETCDQYRDATGHLEDSGSSYAAQRIGEYYAP